MNILGWVLKIIAALALIMIAVAVIIFIGECCIESYKVIHGNNINSNIQSSIEPEQPVSRPKRLA